MIRMIFACLGMPGRSAWQTMMLVKSIRDFAGIYSKSPIWVLVPRNGNERVGPIQEELGLHDARLIPFDVDGAALRFPFAAKVYAAASAEAQAAGQADNLVWLDTDSIIIREPGALILEEGKYLGYRPVDHTLIGSAYDRPADSFWQLIYQYCGVPEGRIFPMTTSVDENVIRPYFNAGMLVVRPEKGFLQLWADNFSNIYRQPEIERFYGHNELYKIFVHQAVLAGTILSALETQELQALSHLVNYPLHMHDQYPADRRPEYMNDLATGRHDTFFLDPNWEATFPVKEPLRAWIKGQLPLRDGEQRSH